MGWIIRRIAKYLAEIDVERIKVRERALERVDPTDKGPKIGNFFDELERETDGSWRRVGM